MLSFTNCLVEKLIMENVHQFIESGILEAYVMGSASREESDLVEAMAVSSIEIRDEIASISEALEMFAFANEVAPDPIVKPMLLASIDYTERMKNGELPSFPPQLNENSIVADYSQWLDRPDLISPDDFDNIHAKIIGYAPHVLTAIVWVKEMAPQEVHDHEYEKFLIVEGTCDITIGDKVHSLAPGNFLSIPLHMPHHVVVTSIVPCKIILQRVAA